MSDNLSNIAVRKSVRGARLEQVRGGMARQAVSVILDTDMGNDIDDALALLVLHSLHDLQEVEMAAVMVSKDNAYAPRYVDLVNTFYGKGQVPIGMVRDGKTPEEGFYLKQIVNARDEHGLRYRRSNTNDVWPSAVSLYRKLLADMPDGSAVIVQIGFFTNLAALLRSGPDEYSELDGTELVAKKVKLTSVMAGNFSETALSKIDSEFAEYNVFNDIDSAKSVCRYWPGEIVFSGIELGEKIKFPAEAVEAKFGWTQLHPVAEAYKIFKPMPYDRPLWDLTSVLYGVRQGESGFDLSEPGKVKVYENGCVSFEEYVGGKHRYLRVTNKAATAIQKELVELSSRRKSVL